MNILQNILDKGDVFQIFGKIECDENGKPQLYHPMSIHYANSRIYVDVQKLVNFSPTESQSVELTSSDKRLYFKLVIRNGLLHGQCIIKENGSPVCLGHWKDGLRDGQFLEFCNGKMVFDGLYKNGVRHGFASEHPSSYMKVVPRLHWYEQSSAVFYDVGKMKDCLLITSLNRTLQVDSIGMYNYQYKNDGVELKIANKNPDRELIYKNGSCIMISKIFPGSNQMVCYDQLRRELYRGGYLWMSPMYTIMHGEGIQGSDGVLYYKGHFERGERSGYGTLYYKNGKRKYTGWWVNDYPNGSGVLYDLDGNEYKQIVCHRGLFDYGLKTYSVFSFIPQGYVLSFFGINYGSSSYERNNPEFYPSSHFDTAFDRSILSLSQVDFTKTGSSSSSAYSDYYHMQNTFHAAKLYDMESVLNATHFILSPNTQVPEMLWHFEIMASLEFIQIGENSLQNECCFSLISLPTLRRVVVGRNCLVYKTGNVVTTLEMDSKLSYQRVKTVTNFPGYCMIVDCPRLQSVEIGSNSFALFIDLVIESRYLKAYFCLALNAVSIDIF